MLSLERNGFDARYVQAALHAGAVTFDFRYELLDADEKKKKDLTTVTGGEVSMKSLSTIKRTARFTMVEDNDVNYLSDRIAPFVRLRLPPGRVLAQWSNFLSPIQTIDKDELVQTPSGWAEFPLGIFLLSAPTRTDDDNAVIRDIQGYDKLLILDDDKFIDRYVITAGTNYRDAISDIIQSAGDTKINIEQTDKTLDKDREFEPGTSKLDAINALLALINYDSLYVDVHGYFCSRSYQSPTQRAAEYTYTDNALSVTLPGVEEEFPINDVPNQFIAVRSNSEDEPLYSSYTNDNPDSPVSTVNRGRTITRKDEVEDIADQEALDGYVQRIADEATRLYGKVSFETGPMPFHDHDDILQFDYSRLGISRKYIETSWTLPLEAGATMKHEVRRVISI